jgi:hypothetical protein
VYINSAEVSVEQFRAELKQRGADSEVTLQKLIAVDIPARAFQIVEEFLVRGKDAGRWELQDGYIFESSPDESHIGGQPQSN